MRINKLLFLSASVFASALFANCSSSTQGTCQETATCPPDASDGPPPLVCDTTKDPKDQAGCLDDRVGVFVDGAGGNDGNPGTKTAPVKTIAKALTLATTLTRLYVCEGTYAEDVTLDASHDGVSIYGGYACGAWTYSGNKPQIGAGTLALKIDTTTKPITIEDVLVKAADATAPGGSSVAALVNGAAGAVSFVRVNLTAGAGKAGADGVTGTNYNASLLSNNVLIKGHDATGGGAGNGGPQLCTGLCTDNVVGAGGAGGQGGTSTQGGATGSPSSLGGGAGGTANTSCGGAGSGGTGADQPTAGADAVSPTALGTLAAGGWAPTSGSTATNGAPGQGGGGGGGASFADNSAGGGGGGGCGGCGGAGGAGGAGGGASIALAALSSTISLTASELHAGNAGNGGKGAAGQGGQSGGLYGNGSAPGCAGGSGGKGSAGGSGAGGVGGISVGILYKGTAPTADSATSAATTMGTAGTKGTGGKAGQNDGIDGVAQALLQAP
ncbi:MAG TPA: hypothetical protein VLM85_18935 [Polyangiaceae bacterium]|nr:hypothetical protein [Polyangiaceae bacterium]